jgi:cytochrome b561
MLRNTDKSWGSLAKFLHWTMALMIFALFALGWVAVQMPRSPAKIQTFVWHKSLGILVLGLVAIRLLWKLANRDPCPPQGPAWEHFAARATQTLLYVLMFTMPISGWILNSSSNIPLKVFGLFRLPNITGQSEELQELAKTAHLILFWIMAVTLVAHVGGALRHHFIKHNDVLTRMLPGAGAKE